MRWIAPFVLALVWACSAPVQSGGAASAEQVELDVEPETASAGGSVALVLRNRSSGTVGYNLCTSGLERRAGNDWQGVPSDRVCTLELRTLAPGAEARYPTTLPAGLAPGEYRFHTNVELMDTGGRIAVRSEPFRVGS